MINIRSKYICKAISALLTAAFVISAFMTNTYAIKSTNYEDHKTNEAFGRPVYVSVTLEKLEKDAQGNITANIVPGAEFYLYKIEGTEHIQIGERYITDKNGQIQVDGLQPGSYYFEETYPGYSYVYDRDDTDNDVRRYDFILTGEEPSNKRVKITAYNRRTESGLIIAKTLRNGDGTALSSTQLDISFAFVVNFTRIDGEIDNQTYFYQINGTGDKIPITNGETLLLKHGQTAVFSGIPVGTQYTVTEELDDSYIISSINNQGTITEEGATAWFTNIHEETEGLGKLTIIKTVSGSNADKEFVFTAIIDGKEETFTLKDGESKTYDGLEIGSQYTIIENDYTSEGYIASPSNYVGNIIEGEQILPFVNVLDDKTGEPGSLTITKTVVNADDTPLTAEQLATEFGFSVTIGDKTETVVLKHGESKVYTDIPHGTAYEVRETSADGYTALIKESTGVIVSNHSAQINFVNQQEREVKRSGSLTIMKTVSGPKADKNKEFVFTAIIDGKEETFTLKDGESKTYDGLEIGSQYTITENDYTSEGYIASPSNYVGYITEGEQILPFVNVLDDKTGDPGSLIITKTVVNTDGTSLTAEQLATEFEFSVTIGDKTETVMLKHGESKVYTDIPHGTAYEIREISADGYTALIKESKGAIVSNYNAQIDFINQKEKTEELKTVLLVKKIVNGEVPYYEFGREFKFLLEVDGMEPVEFSLKAGEIKQFAELPVGAQYTVSELEYTSDGYILKNVINGTGILPSSPMRSIFINEYADRIIIQLSGEKTWDKNGYEIDLPESISIDLKHGENIVETVTVTPDASGRWTYSFDAPKYDIDGNVIEYTVKETAVEGWTAEYNGLDINNIYMPSVLIDTPVKVTKTLTGPIPTEADTYTFALTALNGGPLPNGASGTVVTIDIIGAGEKDFGDMVFYAPGTYYYEITEVIGELDCKYDDNIYTMEVIVEETEDSLLTIKSVTYSDRYGNSSENPKFVNDYSKDATEKININGEKTWNHGILESKWHPKSITVVVKNGDGVVVAERVVTGPDWKYSFTLDRYDDHKNEIVYTVEEKYQTGYKPTYDGYNINNVFDPTDPNIPDEWLSGLVDPADPTSPSGSLKTGDNVNLVLWMILMLISLFGLVAMYIWKRRSDN